jgi:hypothetical protein
MAQPQYQACLDTYKECIERCEDCAYNRCAPGNMATCTRLCIDCGAVCSTCITLLSRGSEFVAELCDACAGECEKHPNMDHCRRCAEACRRCAEQCRSVAGATV